MVAAASVVAASAVVAGRSPLAAPVSPKHAPHRTPPNRTAPHPTTPHRTSVSTYTPDEKKRKEGREASKEMARGPRE